MYLVIYVLQRVDEKHADSDAKISETEAEKTAKKKKKEAKRVQQLAMKPGFVRQAQRKKRKAPVKLLELTSGSANADQSNVDDTRVNVVQHFDSGNLELTAINTRLHTLLTDEANSMNRPAHEHLAEQFEARRQAVYADKRSMEQTRSKLSEMEQRFPKHFEMNIPTTEIRLSQFHPTMDYKADDERLKALCGARRYERTFYNIETRWREESKGIAKAKEAFTAALDPDFFSLPEKFCLQLIESLSGPLGGNVKDQSPKHLTDLLVNTLVDEPHLARGLLQNLQWIIAAIDSNFEQTIKAPGDNGCEQRRAAVMQRRHDQWRVVLDHGERVGHKIKDRHDIIEDLSRQLIQAKLKKRQFLAGEFRCDDDDMAGIFGLSTDVYKQYHQRQMDAKLAMLASIEDLECTEDLFKIFLESSHQRDDSHEAGKNSNGTIAPLHVLNVKLKLLEADGGRVGEDGKKTKSVRKRLRKTYTKMLCLGGSSDRRAAMGILSVLDTLLRYFEDKGAIIGIMTEPLLSDDLEMVGDDRRTESIGRIREALGGAEWHDDVGECSRLPMSHLKAVMFTLPSSQ